MKKLSFYILSVLILLYLFSCGNPLDFNRPGDKLNGYVTHINMNLITGGYYSISVFSADSTNPFLRIPVRTDSLNLKRRDNLYETFFGMNGINAGRYYLAATWSHYPKIPDEVPVVLGILGCDTSCTCTSYQILTYPDYDDLSRNIISWTDTTKRLN